MATDNLIYVMGDTHGELRKTVRLLHEAGLIGENREWLGGDSVLWFMGDFFDRGPDGIGLVELVMRLQREAPRAGGSVGAILGNHEVMFLAAHRFGRQRTAWGGNFYDDWRRNGGQDSDMDRLTTEHIEWITDLPSLMLVRNVLLVHADALFYHNYGHTVEEVNASFGALLKGDDAPAWDRYLAEVSEKFAFSDESRGRQNAEEFLARYGGTRIIHGHTPVTKMTRQPPESVKSEFVYAGGLCTNVDSGMSLGGPGFLFRFPSIEDAYLRE